MFTSISDVIRPELIALVISGIVLSTNSKLEESFASIDRVSNVEAESAAARDIHIVRDGRTRDPRTTGREED